MTLKALGATPVPIPASKVDLSSLDGIEMGAPGVAGNEYDRSAKSFTGDLVFWSRPNVIVANAKWFDSLSSDLQAEVRAAAAATGTKAGADLRGSADDARSKLCARSLPILSAGRAALDGFHRSLQPVVDAMSKDPGTKSTIDAIVAVRGPTDAPDIVAPCPIAVATPSPNAAPTPLDGTWKTTFTKAELVASPLLVDSGEINDGNWGTMTITFAKGRFTSTQANDVESGSGSGTFTVKGDVLYQTIDQTGEQFAYRWSIFKNTLTFKRDDSLGFGGPTPALVKPWSRVP
jgi:hypothetical protein